MSRDDIEIVIRPGTQQDLLRGTEALFLDFVLTDLVPERRDAGIAVVLPILVQNELAS